MEHSVEISFIIPCHNSEEFVEDAIASLDWFSNNCEIICIDDGSIDGTNNKLRELAKKRKNVTVVTNPTNLGLAASRNIGMLRSKGKWIQFLDSDDLINPKSYELVLNVLRLKNKEIVSFDADVVSNTRSAKVDSYISYYNRELGELSGPGRTVLLDQIRSWKFRPSACLYVFRRDLQLRTQLNFSEGTVMEDNFFTFAIFLQASEVTHVPTKAYLRSIREESISFDDQYSIHRNIGYLAAARDIVVFLQHFEFSKSEMRVLETHISKLVSQVGEVPILEAGLERPLTILENALFRFFEDDHKPGFSNSKARFLEAGRRIFLPRNG